MLLFTLRRYGRSGALTDHTDAAKRLLPLPFRRQPGATYTTALAADPQLRPTLFWNGISYDLREFHVADDGRVSVHLGLLTSLTWWMCARRSLTSSAQGEVDPRARWPEWPLTPLIWRLTYTSLR